MPVPNLMLLQSWENLLENVELSTLLVNLALTILMGHLLAWHYIRFAKVLSNKRKFAQIFVFISATTLLVISIVSSSLALSLGLVGALSIVRFRTPIKEPQELAYLFLAIAIGIGMGANEPVITVVVYLIILAYLSFQNVSGFSRSELRSVLQVSGPVESGDPLEVLLPAVEKHCSRVNLRRMDRDREEFNASFLVETKDVEAARALVQGIRDALPTTSVSLTERDALE